MLFQFVRKFYLSMLVVKDNNMKIQEIRNLKKEESCIEYISRYTATVVIDEPIKIEIPIKFEVEKTAVDKCYRIDYQDEKLYVPKIILTSLILEKIISLEL